MTRISHATRSGLLLAKETTSKTRSLLFPMLPGSATVVASYHRVRRRLEPKQPDADGGKMISPKR